MVFGLGLVVSSFHLFELFKPFVMLCLLLVGLVLCLVCFLGSRFVWAVCLGFCLSLFAFMFLFDLLTFISFCNSFLAVCG